ncbi:MAG TPA: MFS transporter [Anaerolineae bacterium]|nr:MFS transporter [Anaerolineae bacterium]
MKNLTDKQRNRILVLLFFGVLIGALDIAIVGPALPVIQRSFMVNDRLISWVVASYILFNMVGTPLMAKLADVIGHRTIYVADILIFALGSLVVALSPTFEIVLVGRAIQGFGASGIFPVAASVIGDTFPPEKRGGALGMIGAVFGVAFLIGPVLGGVILKFLTWHWLFLINIPIALIIVFFALRMLPNKRPGLQNPFDYAGLILTAISLAAVTIGINQLNPQSLSPDTVLTSFLSPKVWPFLLVAVAILPGLWYVEKRAADPVIQVQLFKSRQIKLVAVIALGAGFGESTLIFVPVLLVLAFGVSAHTASFMLLPAVLAMAFGSPTAGRLLDKKGSRLVILIGAGLMAAGMLVIGLLPLTVTIFYVAAVLIGLGLSSLLGSPLRYIMLNEAPHHYRTAAQALIRLFTGTGQLLGSAFVGAIAASLGGTVKGFTSAYLAVGGVAVLITLLALGLKSQSAEQETVRLHEQAANAH